MLHPPNADVIQIWVEFFTPILLGILAAIQAIAAKLQHKVTKEQTKEVKAQSVKLDEVHTLVNGGHGDSLLLAYTALQKLANITNDPNDRQMAEQAKQILDSHNRQQMIVDYRKDARKE